MISEKQQKILAFEYTKSYDALICNGAVRSGKTSIMTIAFIDWAMRNFNNQFFALCSKTVKACYRNVVTPYMSLDYANKRYRMNLRVTDNYLTIESDEHSNTFYIFGGRDESSYMLVQGVTLAGVLLDEAPLMPESFVNQATARCSVEGSRFWFNCNPAGSKEHWFYKNWIEDAVNKKALVLNFTIDDNPSLSADMVARYKSLYHGVFYRRYIMGEWVAAEGSFFIEPPQMFKDANLMRDGIAHIDASYGGGDYTAFTCAKRMGDTIYMYGRLWPSHIDTLMGAIATDCKRLMCAPLYCETNADKGYVGREFRSNGVPVQMYSERMNKFMKITTILRKWWGNIEFLEGTDSAYIAQIMDYTADAVHDDAPDSAACCCRLLDRGNILL